MKMGNTFTSDEKIPEKPTTTKIDPKNLPSIVDVVFCCDATGSMSAHIESSKRTIKKIMQDTIDKFAGVEVKFGFVWYRDHCDGIVTGVKDLNTAEEITKFVQGVNASGGGDTPEAVHCGLSDAILKIFWREGPKKKRVRIIFHITDAPPHGKEYGSPGDSYPNGCPCGVTLEDIAINLSELGIEYVLLKIGNICDKMEELFRESFLRVQAKYALMEVAAGLEAFYGKEFLAFESKKLDSQSTNMEDITTDVYAGKIAKYSKGE